MKLWRHSTYNIQLSQFGLYDNKILGVDESHKHGEELGCKEGESLGVSEWGVDGILGGNIIGTNICNDY